MKMQLTETIGNRSYDDVRVNFVRREAETDAPSVHDCPDGYPILGAFLDSDDNFMVYRRFGYLQSRLLLERQEHLRQLEEELDNLDMEDAQTGSRNLVSMGNYDTKKYKRRRDLMQKIERQFQGYGTRMERQHARQMISK
jgi:hypothetical protein